MNYIRVRARDGMGTPLVIMYQPSSDTNWQAGSLGPIKKLLAAGRVMRLENFTKI